MRKIFSYTNTYNMNLKKFVCTCVCKSRGWWWVSSSITLLLSIKAGSLTWTQSSLIWLGKLTSLFWDSQSLSPYVRDYRRATVPTWHLCGSGIQISSLHTCASAFTHWAILPVQQSNFLKTYLNLFYKDYFSRKSPK